MNLRIYSEVTTWMSCPQMWLYRFIHGLEIHHSPDSPIMRGIAIDRQLSRLAGDLPFDESDLWANKIALRTWENFRAIEPTLMIEHVAPEFAGFVYGGRAVFIHPDLIVRDSNYDFWIVDWKTHAKSFPDPDPTLDPQFAFYAYVLKQHGINPVGYMAVRALQRLPALPKILKSGRVQKPRSCGLTDEVTYKQAIRMAGHYESAYQEELQQVRGMQFFRLDRMRFLPGYVDAVVNEMRTPLEQLMSAKKVYNHGGTLTTAPGVYRKLKTGWAGCDRCGYKSLCHAEMIRGSSESLREAWKEEQIAEKEQE